MAKDEYSDHGREFDDGDHSITWKEGISLFYMSPEFTRLPPVYNYKFAILHLIQACELLLKSYVEQTEPAAIFVKPGSARTIGLQDALRFTTDRNATLFTSDEIALLLQAKDLRNNVEHYKIEFNEARIRSVCIDFLAICMLISQELLSISIVDAFSWDCLKDKADPVGDYLASLANGNIQCREERCDQGCCFVASQEFRCAGFSLPQLRRSGSHS